MQQLGQHFLCYHIVKSHLSSIKLYFCILYFYLFPAAKPYRPDLEIGTELPFTVLGIPLSENVMTDVQKQ